jgi:predicted secreted protein
MSLLTATLFVFTAACGGDDSPDVPTGSIEGTVTLEGDGPAANVTVGFQAESDEVLTGEDGRFSFENVVTGTYTLVIPRDGYVTGRPDVEVVQNETTQVDVTLQQINEPPTIDDISVEPETLEPEGTSTITVTASDPNPDELTYSFEATNGFSFASTDGNTGELSAPDSFGTTGSVTIVVTDEDGATARERLTVATVTNTAPNINGVTAAPSTLQPGGEATVIVSAADAESDQLNYQWSSPMGWNIDDPSAAEITVTAPDTYDASAILDVTVSDDRGFEATASISLSTIPNNGPVISSVTASPQSVARGGNITLNVSAGDPNGDPLSYQWSAPQNWTLDDATIAQPTLTAPESPGETATVEVTVTDSEGVQANGSVVVSTRPNVAPVISSLLPANSNLSRGGSTAVTVSASDPDGEMLSYSWSIGNSNWSYTGSGDEITLNAPDTASSSTMVTVTVTDSAGATTSSTVIVNTVPNGSPTVSSIYPKNNPIARGGSTDIVVNASDPNGDTLSYSWSTNDPSNWTINGNGDTVTLSAPDTPSASTLVTVTVSDDLGASTSATTQVSTVDNKAPVITSLPNIPNQVDVGRGATFSYQATASDPDDPSSSLTWTVDTNPSTSATIDSSGLVTWTIGSDLANTNVTMEVSVSDGNDTVSQTFTVPIGTLEVQTDGTYNVGNNVSIAFADFDGDGLSDLAGTHRFDEDLSYVLSGTGYGTENSLDWGTTVADDCNLDRAGDLDGDSDPDVVSTCDSAASGTNLQLLTWINDIQPSGSFSTGQSLLTGAAVSATDVRVSDLTGDGAAEVIVSDTAGDIHVFSNDGTGTLSGPTTYTPTRPSPPSGAVNNYSIERIHVTEVDGDSDPELVILEQFNTASGDVANAVVFSFTAGGTLQTSRESVTALNRNPDKLQVGDLDGDGVTDLITKTADTSGSNDVLVESYINDGSGSFMKVGSVGSTTLCNTSANRGIALGDIDGDGQTDVVVGNDCDGSVHVAFGNSMGGFDGLIQLQTSTLGSDETEDIYVGNFNTDGYVDIFAYDFGGFSVYY